MERERERERARERMGGLTLLHPYGLKLEEDKAAERTKRLLGESFTNIRIINTYMFIFRLI